MKASRYLEEFMFSDIIFYISKYTFKYRLLRYITLKIIYFFDGGEFYSRLIRKISSGYYKIDVGLYTHGGCFLKNNIDPYTTIGRYCSIGASTIILNKNNPLDWKSTSSIFYSKIHKIVAIDSMKYIPLKIGNDVWFGHNSIIMHNVKEIGDGAVIGAGAVVNKNVPPYAVVIGNPARIVKYRFGKDMIEYLLKSKWWEKSIEELKPHIREFQHFLGNPNYLKREGSELGKSTRKF